MEGKKREGKENRVLIFWRFFFFFSFRFFFPVRLQETFFFWFCTFSASTFHDCALLMILILNAMLLVCFVCVLYVLVCVFAKKKEKTCTEKLFLEEEEVIRATAAAASVGREGDRSSTFPFSLFF